MIDQDEKTASEFRRLMELRDARDRTKKAAETAEKEYRECESEIYEELEESPVRGVRKINLGEPWGMVHFTPRDTKFARILDLDAAEAYFDEREEPEMLKRAPNKRKMNERVRELLEQGKPLPPGMDWYASRGITISKKS